MRYHAIAGFGAFSLRIAPSGKPGQSGLPRNLLRVPSYFQFKLKVQQPV